MSYRQRDIEFRKEQRIILDWTTVASNESSVAPRESRRPAIKQESPLFPATTGGTLARACNIEPIHNRSRAFMQTRHGAHLSIVPFLIRSIYRIEDELAVNTPMSKKATGELSLFTNRSGIRRIDNDRKFPRRWKGIEGGQGSIVKSMEGTLHTLLERCRKGDVAVLRAL